MEINVKVLEHHGQQSVLLASLELVELQMYVRLVLKVLFHLIEESKIVLNAMSVQREEFVMTMEPITSVFQLCVSPGMFVEKGLGKD